MQSPITQTVRCIFSIYSVIAILRDKTPSRPADVNNKKPAGVCVCVCVLATVLIVNSVCYIMTHTTKYSNFNLSIKIKVREVGECKAQHNKLHYS